MAKRRQDYTDASIFSSPNTSRLADVNVGATDRIWFYDASVGTWQFLTVGSGLSISGTTLTGTGAPADAEYIVGALSGSLSAERLVTNTATITWDLSVAGQAKANVVSGASAIGLLSTTTVDTDEVTAQTLYTVPSATNIIVTAVAFRNTSTSLAALTNGVALGFNGGADDWSAGVDITGLNTATKVIGTWDPTNAQLRFPQVRGTAGDIFAALFLDTSITGTLVIDVFGYSY